MAKPERVFKMGAVRASIFRNSFERDGQTVRLPKVVIEVRYKDKNGEWQGTNSLSLNDLPKAITALQQAYEYLLGEGAKGDVEIQSDAGSDSPSAYATSTPSFQARMTTWKPGQTL